MANVYVDDWSGLCSVPDCTRLVDVVLRSSDGKRYGTHSDNLRLFNDSFPSSCPNNKDIPMKENGYTIHLFLLFSHNTDPPDLQAYDLDTVIRLLRAVSVYGNWPAVEACKSAISEIGKRSPNNAFQVLCYKASHGDYEDIDDMARRTMKLPTQHVVTWLRNQPELYMAWSRYKSEWERSMVRFRQILDSGVSRYYDHSDLLWQAFRSEVETEEVPTLDGVKAAEELVTKSNVSQYAYLKLYLVRDLETVIKGFPKWRDMVT